jgi:hypothetical protein
VANIPEDYSAEKLAAHALGVSAFHGAKVLYLSANPPKDEILDKVADSLPDELAYDLIVKQFSGDPLDPPARLIAKDCKKHRIDLILMQADLPGPIDNADLEVWNGIAEATSCAVIFAHRQIPDGVRALSGAMLQ